MSIKYSITQFIVTIILLVFLCFEYVASAAVNDSFEFQGIWKNQNANFYLQVGSNDSAILCDPRKIFWDYSKIHDSSMYRIEGFPDSTLNVSGNTLLQSTIRLPKSPFIEKYKKVFAMPQPCSDLATKLFTDLSNVSFQGVWYNSNAKWFAPNSKAYYQINNDNTVYVCIHDTVENLYFAPYTGTLRGNVAFFDTDTELFTLENSMLTMDKPFFSSVQFQEISSFPTECESLFANN